MKVILLRFVRKKSFFISYSCIIFDMDTNCNYTFYYHKARIFKQLQSNNRLSLVLVKW